MGALFGGGGGNDYAQIMAQRRQDDADKKADALTAKQDAEAEKLKTEEEATKLRLEDRRRRIASGIGGRRSLFTADETGYARSTQLGAS